MKFRAEYIPHSIVLGLFILLSVSTAAYWHDMLSLKPRAASASEQAEKNKKESNTDKPKQEQAVLGNKIPTTPTPTMAQSESKKEELQAMTPTPTPLRDESRQENRTETTPTPTQVITPTITIIPRTANPTATPMTTERNDVSEDDDDERVRPLVSDLTANLIEEFPGILHL